MTCAADEVIVDHQWKTRNSLKNSTTVSVVLKNDRDTSDNPFFLNFQRYLFMISSGGANAVL